MSETFTATSGLIFKYGNSDYVHLRWNDPSSKTLLSVPLKSLLEFADSIEQRECEPVEPPLPEPFRDNRARAWMEVFNLCRTLGMSCSRDTGLEDVKAFISNLHAGQQSPTERTKLLAMMAATMLERQDNSIPDVTECAKAILDAVEQEN